MSIVLVTVIAVICYAAATFIGAPLLIFRPLAVVLARLSSLGAIMVCCVYFVFARLVVTHFQAWPYAMYAVATLASLDYWMIILPSLMRNFAADVLQADAIEALGPREAYTSLTDQDIRRMEWESKVKLQRAREEAEGPATQLSCLLCESQAERSRCVFHAGEIVTCYAGTPGDPYREKYYWTCCGKSEVEFLSAGPPRRRDAGCASRRNHLRAARVTLVYSQEEERTPLKLDWFEQNGISVSTTSVEKYTPESNPADAVFLLAVGSGDGERVIRASEELSKKARGVPVIVYSDTEATGGSPFQLSSTEDATEGICHALKSAIRSRYSPRRWQPDVFVSYTRKSLDLVGEYINRMRVSFWLDVAILTPGVRWATEILTGIRQSRLFFLVITPETPEPTYCWLELREALKLRKPVFVVCHGDTESKLFEATATRAEDWRSTTVDSEHKKGISVRTTKLDGSLLILFDAIPTAMPQRVADVADDALFWGILKSKIPDVLEYYSTPFGLKMLQYC